MAAVICIIGLIILSTFADFYLGRYFHRKKCGYGKYPLRKGRLKLITSGADLYAHYFDDLYQAQTSIHVLFYIVKNDKFGVLFLDVLAEQARKGVKVRLLLDWFGSRKVSKQSIERARQAGIEVMFCHRPRFPFLIYSLHQRNHRKITVIDGKVGYIGGFNVGREYIDLHPILSPWRDYHLRVEGEGVADLQSEFIYDWKSAARQDLCHDASLFPELAEGPMSIQFFPSRGVHAEEEMATLINGAKRAIFIGTPYFIPTEILMRALEHAADRGVEVTILVPNQPDHPIVKEASFPYLRRVLRKGGTVYQYTSGFFHAKVLQIDDRFCDIGTANFDRRSLHLNHEINCFIFDPAFIEKVTAEITADMNNSEKLTAEDLNRLPLAVRLKEWAGCLMREIL